MAVSGNIFSFFLPSQRRRRALPTLPAPPQEAALVKGLEEAYAAVDALNLPNEVGENFKKDLISSLDIATPPTSYQGLYPGNIARLSFNLSKIFQDPVAGTVGALSKYVGEYGSDITRYIDPRYYNDRVLGPVLKQFKDRDTGNNLLPSSTSYRLENWASAAGATRTARLGAQEGILDDPGLIEIWAGELASANPGLVINGVTIADVITESGTSRRILDSLRSQSFQAARIGDWNLADQLGNRIKNELGGFKERLELRGVSPSDVTREFELLVKSNPGISTDATRLYRTLKGQQVYYGVFDFLKAWKKGGISEVAREYVWKAATKAIFKEGTAGYYLYPPNLIKEGVKRVFGGQTGRLAKLVRSQVANVRKFLIQKIGPVLGGLLKKVFAVMGGLSISVTGPVGPIVAAIVNFIIGDIILKALGGTLKILAYTIGGLVAFSIALGIGLVVLLSIILANIPYPWEQGGSASLQRFVQIEVKACDTAAGCSYQNPLRVSNGQHSIGWRVVIKNISPVTLTGSEFTFSQTQCTGSGAFDFALAPGAERVAVCSSSFTETDEVVSNVVSFASSGPATNEESVGIVIFGNPPVVLPTGWPVGKGCITQGPDGSYSHGGTEAIDIGSISTGTAVRATFNGVVQTACWASGDGCDPDGYGNYVRLSSLNGNFSAVFGHLATTSVKSGDQVTVGQQVGTVDNTGNSSGTHLHYEFRSLPMAEPYIPRDTGSHGSIRDCSDASECGLCF